MPNRFGPRRALLGGRIASVLSVLQNIAGYLVSWPLQETSGAVSLADNIAVALGRNVVLEGTFPNDPGVWTLAGVWTIAGGLCSGNGANGAGEILAQAMGTNFFLPNSWRVTFTISNYVAGSVQVRLGGVTTGTVRSGNDTYVQVIENVSTGSVLNFIPVNFDGDLSNIVIEQTDILASSAYPGAELLTNTGNPFTFTGGLLDNWTTVETGDATGDVIETAGEVRLLKTSGSANIQQKDVVAGVRYRMEVVVTAVSGGGVTARDTLGGLGANIITTTGTHIFEGIATGGKFQIIARTNSDTTVKSASLSIANPLNGDGTGTTPGVAGGGNIQYMWGFDGATSFDDISSAELNSIFDPTKGTLIVAARVANAGVWTDGVARRLINLEVAAGNQVSFQKIAANNSIRFIYWAGGTLDFHDHVLSSPTDIFVLTMTWDTVADSVKYYENETLVSSDTGLGTWVGNFASTKANIGANSTIPQEVWHGDLAYPTLYNEALTEAEIAAIVKSMGV